MVIAGVIWLIVYAVLKPIVDTLLFLAVGLFASSIARTRSGGLFTAGGMRVALGVVSYVFSQILSSSLSILMLPAMMMPASMSWFERLATEQPELLVLGVVATTVIIALITLVGEFVLMLVLLNITSKRAERLPFNQ